MKTFDPDDPSFKAEQASSGGCSGCEDPKNIGNNILTACQIMVNAHTMISGLYKDLAKKAKTTDDRNKFEQESVKHKSMAEMSSNVVLPD